jgi:hemerythrin-like domain-containing protein
LVWRINIALILAIIIIRTINKKEKGMHEQFFNLLKKDHQEVMDFLDQIQDLSDHSFKKREDLFNQMKEELVPHLRAEEKAFYAVLLQNKEAKEGTMEGMEEHHAAELILTELTRMSPEEEYWPAKLSVFKELVSHHIEEEESKIFQVAREVIDEDKMNSIMEKFQAEKEKVRKTEAVKAQAK